MIVQIAWRNIWRYPRRTAVIMLAVLIGVWSMIFLGAVMRGMSINIFENGISILTGNIQILPKGYREDPSIENRIHDLQSITSVLSDVLPKSTKWTSRVRVNAIASNARHSSSVTLIGIDPLVEPNISFIQPSVICKGQFLTSTDQRGILVGKAFLEKYQTRLGNKIIIMTQNTENGIESKAFRIIGVYQSELSMTEKQFVFITHQAIQSMLNISNEWSEVCIRSQRGKSIDSYVPILKDRLPKNVEVYTWEDMLPVLKAMIALTDGFTFIWYFVVFIAMGLGIVNTLFMAIYERMREFGILKALGMNVSRIICEVLLESSYILIIGVVCGNIIASLMVFGLSFHGIDLSKIAVGSEMLGLSRTIYPVLSIKDIIIANLVVLCLGILVSLFPALKAAQFTPVEAMAK